MRPKQLITTFSASQLDQYNYELRGIVKEKRDHESNTFYSERSILNGYKRELIQINQDSWHEKISFSIHVPGVSWLLAIAIKRHLKKLPNRDTFPFWHPPTQLEPATILSIWTLIGIAFLNSYYATLLGQLLTFTASEFHSSTATQGLVLGFSRLDIVPALFLLFVADKIGRSKIILFSTAMGAVFSTLGALAPNMYFLAADQILTKAFATSAILLIAIVSSEIVPATARAWSLASLVIGSALGAGAAAAMIPLAGISAGSWRILYAVSILALLAIKPFSKHLKESERFRFLSTKPTFSNGELQSQKNRQALILLCIASFLLNLFFIPASQFRNEFLSHDQSFSPLAISIFTIITAAPGAIGLALGGRLSETKGRRIVSTVALIIGTGGLMMAFLSKGAMIWIWAILGSTISPAVIPSLGVYGTELFPTKYRGKANGIIGVWSRIGSIVGVVGVGFLGSTIYNQVGTPLALMGIGPLLLAVIIFFRFPETKGLELETINPEDASFKDPWR
ncbi:MAG: MFS transporter [Actinobacteria bacterium]|nr:MFS transporter [Actinomycetota bacterium]